MPCAEALLWASRNTFAWTGSDTATYAAMTCVSLLGRNEGGLTLDKETVDCVIRSVHRYFDTSPSADWITKGNARAPAKRAAGKLKLLVDMVIADASEFVISSRRVFLCLSSSLGHNDIRTSELHTYM